MHCKKNSASAILKDFLSTFKDLWLANSYKKVECVYYCLLRFLSRVSTLTRDIDIAILSCLSATDTTVVTIEGE